MRSPETSAAIACLSFPMSSLIFLSLLSLSGVALWLLARESIDLSQRSQQLAIIKLTDSITLVLDSVHFSMEQSDLMLPITMASEATAMLKKDSHLAVLCS